MISRSASLSPDHAAQIRTFLIADVRGYTQFTDEHGDRAAASLAARFAQVTRTVVGEWDGKVIELRGDEALAVFMSSRQALWAAAELQRQFGHESRTEPELPLRVGIGIDAGEAIPVEGGFRGAALNLAARLCSLAGPGEVLASETVTNIARKLDGLEYRDRGTVQLKGFAEPARVIEVAPEARPVEDRRNLLALPEREQRLPIGGFLGALPTGVLVARQSELERILTAAETAAEGEGRTVLLAGEPGAGKTRLAQEATLHLRNRGFLIAAGRCYESDEAIPYFPFLDALSATYEYVPASVQQELPRRWPYLGALLPDHISVPENAGGSQDEQQRVFRAVAGFLQSVAETGPIAILLDDLHWADVATVKLLMHLARHTRTSPVLLLGTYRDVQVGQLHPFHGALRDLQREALVQHIDVRRLDESATAELVSASFEQEGISQEFTRLLHERTEGNPYFVQQVLRALVERGDVYRTVDRWERRALDEIEVPDTVRAVIEQRVSQLPEQTQEILREAAILGQTFTFDDLQAMADRSEDEIEGALDAATERGLLRLAGKEDYAFDHALTHQVLYEDLSPRRRRRLHRAAGEALEHLPERIRARRTAELARHFFESGDSARAIPYGLQAGIQAHSVFAQDEAERQFRAVLAALDEIDDEERRAEALVGLGRTLSSQARYGESLAALEQAGTLYVRLGRLRGEAQVAVEIGRVHRSRGTPEESFTRIAHILPALEKEPPSQELTALHITLAQLYFISGRHEEAVAASGRAIELAEGLRDTGLLALAKVRYGTSLASLDHWEEGLRMLEEAIPLAEETGDLSTLATALNNLSESYRLAGRLQISRELRTRALEVSERTGDPAQIAFASATLGWQIYALGDWKEARAYIERGLNLVRATGLSWYAGSVFLHLGELSMAEGTWKEASDYLTECVEVLSGLPGASERLIATGFLGELDLLQGRPGAALLRLEQALRGVNADDRYVLYVLPQLASAALACGDEERAAEVAGQVLARARLEPLRLHLPAALRIQALILAQQGLWEDAEKALEEAVDAARAMPYPYAEARALLELGLIAAQQRDEAQARDRLQDALTIFQRLGAVQDRARTEAALADLRR